MEPNLRDSKTFGLILDTFMALPNGGLGHLPMSFLFSNGKPLLVFKTTVDHVHLDESLRSALKHGAVHSQLVFHTMDNRWRQRRNYWSTSWSRHPPE